MTYKTFQKRSKEEWGKRNKIEKVRMYGWVGWLIVRVAVVEIAKPDFMSL